MTESVPTPPAGPKVDVRMVVQDGAVVPGTVTAKVVAPIEDELPEHRVSVTVFATVRGVDELDAGSIAQVAVRRALLDVRATEDEFVVMCPHRDGDRPVRIHTVMETGMAAGNGYLWTHTTSKAYRENP